MEGARSVSPYQSFTRFSSSRTRPQDHFGALMSHYDSYQTISAPRVRAGPAQARLFVCLLARALTAVDSRAHADIRSPPRRDLSSIHFSPSSAGVSALSRRAARGCVRSPRAVDSGHRVMIALCCHLARPPVQPSGSLISSLSTLDLEAIDDGTHQRIRGRRLRQEDTERGRR